MQTVSRVCLWPGAALTAAAWQTAQLALSSGAAGPVSWPAASHAVRFPYAHTLSTSSRQDCPACTWRVGLLVGWLCFQQQCRLSCLPSVQLAPARLASFSNAAALRAEVCTSPRWPCSAQVLLPTAARLALLARHPDAWPASIETPWPQCAQKALLSAELLAERLGARLDEVAHSAAEGGAASSAEEQDHAGEQKLSNSLPLTTATKLDVAKHKKALCCSNLL